MTNESADKLRYVITDQVRAEVWYGLWNLACGHLDIIYRIQHKAQIHIQDGVWNWEWDVKSGVKQELRRMR